jgi:hypothetical protein
MRIVKRNSTSLDNAGISGRERRKICTGDTIRGEHFFIIHKPTQFAVDPVAPDGRRPGRHALRRAPAATFSVLHRLVGCAWCVRAHGQSRFRHPCAGRERLRGCGSVVRCLKPSASMARRRANLHRNLLRYAIARSCCHRPRRHMRRCRSCKSCWPGSACWRTDGAKSFQVAENATCAAYLRQGVLAGLATGRSVRRLCRYARTSSAA